jgi:dihydroorotase-like cyclic amidohydrolase
MNKMSNHFWPPFPTEKETLVANEQKATGSGTTIILNMMNRIPQTPLPETQSWLTSSQHVIILNDLLYVHSVQRASLNPTTIIIINLFKHEHVFSAP